MSNLLVKSQDKYRKRLLEAMVFFAQKLKHPNKTVIFKVLAELDFKHFERTGIPVTNMEYEAWERGPVPRELYQEITREKDLVVPEDFKSALSCAKKQYVTKSGEPGVEFTFHNKRKADLSVFSPRQIEIMEDVAFAYKFANATISSHASHEMDKPWYKAVKKYGREGVVIKYLDQLTADSPVSAERAIEMRGESKALKQNLRG